MQIIGIQVIRILKVLSNEIDNREIKDETGFRLDVRLCRGRINSKWSFEHEHTAAVLEDSRKTIPVHLG